MKDFFHRTSELTRLREPFAVVTLLSVRGGAPSEPGAKAIVTRAGLAGGTVGGGKVEARAITHAIGLLEKRANAPEVVVWNLQRDIGMTCGGEVTILFEAHGANPWRI